jgi:hypothetical protein
VRYDIYIYIYMCVCVIRRLKFKNEELIGTAEYLMLSTGCGINRCRYNRVVLCVYLSTFKSSVPVFVKFRVSVMLLKATPTSYITISCK